MSKIDRYKILIRHLIKSGVVASQRELGQKMGYNNPSAFSQVINEKTQEPKLFTRKLKDIVPDLNLDWLDNGTGSMFGGGNEPAQQNANKQVQVNGDSLDFITAGGEAFSSMIVRMMNEKQIAPYGLLEEKDKAIANLNRQIGRLEALLEVAKKGNCPTGRQCCGCRCRITPFGKFPKY